MRAENEETKIEDSRRNIQKIEKKYMTIIWRGNEKNSSLLLFAVRCYSQVYHSTKFALFLMTCYRYERITCSGNLLLFRDVIYCR